MNPQPLDESTRKALQSGGFLSARRRPGSTRSLDRAGKAQPGRSQPFVRAVGSASVTC